MTDIALNSNLEILFDAAGDFLINEDFNVSIQDINILLLIDVGHNKQFPNLGVALWKSINGKESELFSSIISNAASCSIKIKNIFIDENNSLQIQI